MLLLRQLRFGNLNGVTPSRQAALALPFFSGRFPNLNTSCSQEGTLPTTKRHNAVSELHARSREHIAYLPPRPVCLLVNR